MRNVKRLFGALALGAIALSSLGLAPEGATEGSCRVHEPEIVDPATGTVTKAAVELCEVPNYIQCDGDSTHAGKVHLRGDQALTGGPIPDDMPSLSTQPPDSVSAGAGCGTYDEPAGSGTIQDTPYDFNFAGTIEGNLDTMTIVLHSLSVDDKSTSQPQATTIGVRVTIDGKSPFGTETTTSVDGTQFESPRTVTAYVQPVLADNGATYEWRATITRMDQVLGLANEAGTGEGTLRNVIVTIGWTADLPTGVHPWVWGADEIASGVILNPTPGAPTGAILPASG